VSEVEPEEEVSEVELEEDVTEVNPVADGEVDHS